ncbi:MAG: hypothetical protein CFE36_12800 [Sphingomonadaceae bacterium PASS1]|nr:MAG: hypothetical protein CFE36_12800 [Sphingomonadaceae bacterium PASS1]
MRILIYLLAMLSGFSAADAARPVSSSSASVDLAAVQAYVTAAVQEADNAFEQPVHVTPTARVHLMPVDGSVAFVALVPDTPVYRHDLILG